MKSIALSSTSTPTSRVQSRSESRCRRTANAASRARFSPTARARGSAKPVCRNISGRRMNSRACSVEGCDRRVDARGLCSTHYARFRSRGTTDKWIRSRKPTPPPLDALRLRQLLQYDAQTGAFEWKADHASSLAGAAAGRVYPNGYVTIWIDGRPHRAHRLAWLHVHGEWPSNLIDHVNGVRSDNRIENLRDVASRINCQNRRSASPSNKAGVLGVHRYAGRWEAFISHNRKSIYLGRFSTPELAHEAYLRAKREIHAGCTL